MRHITIMLFVALLVLSCGKSDPITSGVDSTERFVMNFGYAPVAIFSGNYDYLDADAAAIMNGFGTGPGNWDTVWEDGDEQKWSVATALEYEGSETHILYRFLGDDADMETMSAMFTIDDLPVKIRFPRVASSYFDVNENTKFVEVAIAYQYWNNGDWDIGVVRMGFNPLDFEDDGIDDIAPIWTAVSVEQNMTTLVSEIHPDIAYNPGTGDLWLVYSKSEGEGVWHIYVLQGRRQGTYKTEVPWNIVNEQIAQRTDEDHTHNGFHPRIDIGYITLPGYNLNWMLVIAYTGGHEPGTTVNGRWHIRVNYWPVSGLIPTPFSNNWYVHDSVFDNYPAGVPMIDIGPQGSDFGALVWTQAKADDWSNCTLSYLDSRYGMYHQSLDAEWAGECTAFPSVVAHPHSGGPHDPYNASVSYLRTANYVNGYWNPKAVLLTTDPDGPWGEKTSAGDALPISSTIHGKWDPGGIVEHYLGLSTALTVMDDRFWVIWSGYDEGAGPDTVYGSFGWTTP
jgi:hypothetical protein